MRLFIIAGVLLVIAVLIYACIKNKEKINFFTHGIEENFNMNEISTLWRLAKENNLENPYSLYFSVPTINRCISNVISESKLNGTEYSERVQTFLRHLYDFRTKVTLTAENKKGVNDTRSIENGQRLRVLLKGKGVYLAKVLNNARELVISIPKKEGIITINGDEWIGQKVSVYLWRKNDASYVFDSLVVNSGVFFGELCLYLQHTDKLLRAQKRQSVRCACKIYAQMYLIISENYDPEKPENEPGFRCLLEDISEDGAMIRIGGLGKKDVMIKLQFSINNTFIMMFGVIRAVEYNQEINQSRLHFECLKIEPSMKNIILSYVYNVIPDDIREINEAISQTESDAIENDDSENNPEQSEDAGNDYDSDSDVNDEESYDQSDEEYEDESEDEDGDESEKKEYLEDIEVEEDDEDEE